MTLAIALSAVMGIVLGLLGGGGSILTVPILIYALGLGPAQAIATSLVVVGVTSAVAAVQHALAGNVSWRVGAIFSGGAMLGAYGGGRIAGLVSGQLLLLSFVVMMIVTGIAMLYHRRARRPSREVRRRAALLIAIDGLAVGTVTGLVGAGGGFVVVPALVLLGRMPVRRAIGTSLMVIALNAFAGLAGHLAHTRIDLQLAALVTTAAVAGSILGARLAQRVDPARLRRAFAWFVLALAAVMSYQLTPPGVRAAIFTERWPFWAGGAAIGLFVIVFLLLGRRPLGVSSGFSDLCAVPYEAGARRSWRLPFVGGIILGGFVAALLAGGWTPTAAMGLFDAAFGLPLAAKAAVFGAGGVLIGFGTRLAGGCTSGHGIVGMAQLAPSSIVATLSFMGAGFLLTNALLRAAGV